MLTFARNLEVLSLLTFLPFLVARCAYVTFTRSAFFTRYYNLITEKAAKTLNQVGLTVATVAF